MASITWTCVYLLLLLELVVTFVLVVPVPRRIRNWIARNFIFKFHLGDQVGKAVGFIAVALVLALVESYLTVQKIMDKLQILEHQDMEAGPMGHHHHHGHHHDKQRLYKAERNVYLAGFALTLLFVIARILQLMQESVMLEEAVDVSRRSELGLSINDNDKLKGVEMKEIHTAKQPQDKKKD